MKILCLVLMSFMVSNAEIKNRAIDFVITQEGGYHVFGGIEYNYGLSGKYYGNVKNMTEKRARAIYDSLWYASGSDKVQDTIMAFIYFDTYVLFNPTTSKQILNSCYGYDEFFMRRVQEHVEKSKPCKNCKDKLIRKARREMMYGYMKRISDLRDEIAK